MVWTVLKTIIGALVILGISAGHIIAIHLLERPFSSINIILLCAMVLLFTFETKLVVWITIALFYIIDLYSTVTPFGITLYSGTVAILLGFWFHRSIFTNRSWYAAAALTACIVFLFRSLYLLGLFVVDLLRQTSVVWGDLLLSIFWEAVLTSMLVAVSVFILSLFIRDMTSRTVEEGLFVIHRDIR